MKNKEPVRRKCVGCGKILEKESLVRIARDREGRVAIDPTGYGEGRGAYVCSGKCMEAALKKRSFERSFRMKIREEDREGLRLGFAGLE